MLITLFLFKPNDKPAPVGTILGGKFTLTCNWQHDYTDLSCSYKPKKSTNGYLIWIGNISSVEMQFYLVDEKGQLPAIKVKGGGGGSGTLWP